MEKLGTVNQTNKIIEWCLVVLVFLGPLIMSLINYDIYGLPKLVVTYIVVFVITVSWAIKWFKAGEVRFIRTPLDVPILVFVVLAALSTATSIHPSTSLYGVEEQYQGLFSLFTYALIYFAVVNTIEKPGQLIRLSSALLISSTIIAVYGILQHFGIDFITWSAETDFTRIVSTLGNSNFLAGYLVIVLPLALSTYLTSTSKANQLTSFAAVMFLFLALLFTYSRAGWVGLLFSVIFLLVLARKELPTRKLRLVGVGILLAVLTLFANYSTAFNIGYRKLPSLTAQARSSIETRGGTVAERLRLYRSALFMTRDRPVLGWGVQTFGVVFPQYKPYTLSTDEPKIPYHDQVHNELLQISTGAGTLGLLGFLWLVSAFVLIAFRTIPQISNSRLKLPLAGLFSGLAGYLVAIQFNFSIIGVAFLFWLGMAGMIAAPNLASLKKTTNTISLNKSRIPLAVLLVFFFLFLTTTGFRQLAADIYFAQGLEAANRGQLDLSLSPLEKATAIWPNRKLYARVLVDVYLAKTSNTKNLYWSDLALDQAEQMVRQYPIDPSTHVSLGNVYVKKYDLSKQKAFLNQAISAYKYALRLDLLNSNIHYDLGLSYEKLGSARKACHAYKKVLKLSPQDSNVYRDAHQALNRVRNE